MTAGERPTWKQAHELACASLLAAQEDSGHWVGRLSTSALSTATSVMALHVVQRGTPGQTPYQDLIDGGLRWLADQQNADGGWGDTDRSLSNISTTMLAYASLRAASSNERYRSTELAALEYIAAAGGVAAVRARYGKDHTFSIPILTHCALAGIVQWSEIPALPFELAWLPPSFYKTVRLPVVSYALPALIAIGQVRHFHHKPRNPFSRIVRNWAREPTLRRLETLQPENGGFLEAAPLTGFVTMSLAAMGLVNHPVTRRGVEFLLDSVRPDGSWPIDTNLTTWVTTLAVNGLQSDLPDECRTRIGSWLLGQQNRTVHPYTQADPGGWAWTDLPGGVPDADDTPGALLALRELHRHTDWAALPNDFQNAAKLAVRWLLDLQNRDGGWPTFCRGWGTLPFDRSSPDITAHAMRALSDYQQWWSTNPAIEDRVLSRAVERGQRFLSRAQRSDGAWVPLWFGNQHVENDENPLYGTARVVLALAETGRGSTAEAARGVRWLCENQHLTGGWGGCRGVDPSIEETALALEAIAPFPSTKQAVHRGANWLAEQIERGQLREATPIGFYFAKLWYFEELYPLVYSVAALRAVLTHWAESTNDGCITPTADTDLRTETAGSSQPAGPAL